MTEETLQSVLKDALDGKFDADAQRPSTAPCSTALKHDFDDDAVCTKCGFDGAEHWWLNKHLPPGEKEPMPPCR